MILAERLLQKLNNLRSKGELLDFFVVYDESRSLEINTDAETISPAAKSNLYTESSDGYYTFIWNEKEVSCGRISSDCVEKFDEFITLAKKNCINYTPPIFIPERVIYPLAVNYSKTLADLIDLPEYLLKISDISIELNKMLGINIASCRLLAKEGVKYAYSSKHVDESYSYTEFRLENKMDDFFVWHIEESDFYPISKIHEIFTFYGNLINNLKSEVIKIEKDDKYSLVLPPIIFQKLFKHQILENLDGNNVLYELGQFTKEDFHAKLKAFGTLSLSYDPLINNKLGTYKFTSCGYKAKKQYFIKFGKLDTPILNNRNFKQLDYSEPTVEIAHFSNLKIDGLKKKSYESLDLNKESYIIGLVESSYKKTDCTTSQISFNHLAASKKGQQVGRVENLSFEINLLKELSNNNIELIEFIDGQIGCKINNISF